MNERIKGLISVHVAKTVWELAGATTREL